MSLYWGEPCDACAARVAGRIAARVVPIAYPAAVVRETQVECFCCALALARTLPVGEAFRADLLREIALREDAQRAKRRSAARHIRSRIYGACAHEECPLGACGVCCSDLAELSQPQCRSAVVREAAKFVRFRVAKRCAMSNELSADLFSALKAHMPVRVPSEDELEAVLAAGGEAALLECALNRRVICVEVGELARASPRWERAQFIAAATMRRLTDEAFADAQARGWDATTYAAHGPATRIFE